MKLTVSRFDRLPVGQRFVSLQTFELTKNVFRKIENTPPLKRWSIGSNAEQMKNGLKVHFEKHVIVVPESEFHKLGIE